MAQSVSMNSGRRFRRGALHVELTPDCGEVGGREIGEHGVKVRYLHSDIDTVERVEIIRDLRIGEFDTLVGINLLREGLDLPEVSLVAILDADKEGFLRSERSLIQAIGRAARHLHGTAIMYGDKVTRSMQQAIDETDRRRRKQIAYNEAHGITPKGVYKKVKDLIDGIYQPDAERDALKAAQTLSSYRGMNEKELSREFKRLERDMHDAARNLEFERAAELRDQLKQLRVQLFGIVEEDRVDVEARAGEPETALKAGGHKPATLSAGGRNRGR